MCPCGQPLHYSNEATERQMRALVAEMGDIVTVRVAEGAWRMSRHYIALHGIKGKDVPEVAERLGCERV